ncbi:MAG: hypothetical protein AAGC93_12460 [Cyanobacteria bacterium P01_F01_bin.53]
MTKCLYLLIVLTFGWLGVCFNAIILCLPVRAQTLAHQDVESFGDHELASHELASHELASHELAGHKLAGHKLHKQTIEASLLFPSINHRDATLIAAPQNLNPGLQIQPVLPPISPEPEVVPQSSEEDPVLAPEVNPESTPDVKPDEPGQVGDEGSLESAVPFLEWDELEIDFSDASSNFGQGNRLLTPVLSGHLANGDKVFVSSGFNQFALPDLEAVRHVPVTLGWEREIENVTLAVSGGLDIYNRLPLDTHFNVSASIPVGSAANLTLSLEQGPYFFNAQTLENGISMWRFGPDLFWQIDPDTTFFSLVRFGDFNDGNFEQQSFSRLERKFWGDAAIAANVFNWRFQENFEATSGYFSPPDFLVASLEVSWEKEIIDDISCRVAASVGQQRLNGSWALGYGHQASCALGFLPGFDFDLGYNFSNVSNGQSFLAEESAFNNFEWVGGVKTEF